MKIFGFDITRNEIKNETQVEKPKPIVNYIDFQQSIHRISSDMARYKNAVTAAENIQFPTRTELYQLYVNSVLDAHWSAVWEQRKNLTLRKEFCIKTGDEENEEKTKTINKKWFYDFLNLSLDSKAWGHSLIQFGDYDKAKKEFKNVTLVPRQYVNPPKHVVTQTQSGQTGLDYTLPEYQDWVMSVGDDWDLGLLMKATPYLIWKKNALGAWAEYQETFGVPLRIGKTDSTDAATVNQMKSFLSNFGISKWGLFKKNDTVDIHETTNSDAFNVFDKMIDKVDQQISKLVLGQTGTTDEKAFTGSAEVHERVLDTYEDADEIFIMNILNGKLKPILIKHGLMSEEDEFGYNEEEDIDPIEQIKIDSELLKYFDLSPEYIKDVYGTEVTPKSVQEAQDYKNALDEYYK